jgi:hypothetical protein
MATTPEQIDLWRQSPSEHRRLEFKEAKTQFDNRKLYEYCVALANEGGGRLLLGVADKPPRPVVGMQAFSDPVAMAVVMIFEPKAFEDMDRDDRIRACYQHCALQWVMSERMTNQSLRERFHLLEGKSAIVSQIIAATIEAGNHRRAHRPQRPRRSALRHLLALQGPLAPAAGAGRKPRALAGALARRVRRRGLHDHPQVLPEGQARWARRWITWVWPTS